MDREAILAKRNIWEMLKQDPADLEERYFSHIEGGGFIHEFCESLAIQERELTQWLASTPERRAKWEKADDLAKSVLRSRIRSVLAKIAMADVRNLYAEDGSLKPADLWPDAEAKAISSVDTQEGETKDGFFKKIKVRLNDPVKAAELLGRELGMQFAQKVTHEAGKSLESILKGTWDDEKNEPMDTTLVPHKQLP